MQALQLSVHVRAGFVVLRRLSVISVVVFVPFAGDESLGAGGECIGQTRGIFELSGVQEVQQREELLEIVLQRGSGEQTPKPRVQRGQRLRQPRLKVFKSVTFVDDHRAPRNLLQLPAVRHGHLVGRHHDVQDAARGGGGEIVHAARLTRARVANVRRKVHPWAPFSQFIHPIRHRGQRHHHQHRVLHQPQRVRRGGEHHRLNRLT